MANQFFGYNNPDTTPKPFYTAGPPLPSPPIPAATYTTKATLGDSYFLSDSSVYATAARYLIHSSKLAAHSSFPASSSSSSMYNYHATDIAANEQYSIGEYSRIGALAGRDVWSGVDAITYQSLALKRSSEGLGYAIF